MDAFTNAAQVQQVSDEPKNEEVVVMGSRRVAGTITAAICLISLLGDKAEHDRDLIESLPEEVYKKALEITPEVIASDYKKIYSDEMRASLTPHRGWPLALTDAFYLLQHYKRDGIIHGFNIPLFSTDENFPEECRQEQYIFAGRLINATNDFLEIVVKKVQRHLDLRYPFHSSWFYEIGVEANKDQACEDKADLSRDLNEWFPKYFHAILPEVHARLMKYGARDYEAYKAGCN